MATFIKEVYISSAVNGWVVRVGCMTFVFTNVDNMLGDVRKYFLDTDELLEEYAKRYPEIAEYVNQNKELQMNREMSRAMTPLRVESYPTNRGY